MPSKIDRMENFAKNYVANRPLTSLAIASAVGLVLGRLTPPRLVLSAGILLANWAADHYLNVKGPLKMPSEDEKTSSYPH